MSLTKIKYMQFQKDLRGIITVNTVKGLELYPILFN